MVVWLGEWLRDIVAVLLLAALVELLLPSKAMARYARLVVGLIVLLTVLSPIMRLFKTDVQDLFRQGLTGWQTESARQAVQMQSLEQIQKQAASLGERQQQAAAMIFKQSLEDAIGSALEASLSLTSPLVEANLDFSKVTKQKPEPTLRGIAVRIRLPIDKVSSNEWENSHDNEQGAAVEAIAEVNLVEEVEPVEVSIKLPALQRAQQAEEQISKRMEAALQYYTEQVRLVIGNQWGVPPAMISVSVERAE